MLFKLQLPCDLDTFRIPGNLKQAEEKIRQDLDEIFDDRGFTLWTNALSFALKCP